MHDLHLIYISMYNPFSSPSTKTLDSLVIKHPQMGISIPNVEALLNYLQKAIEQMRKSVDNESSSIYYRLQDIISSQNISIDVKQKIVPLYVSIHSILNRSFDTLLNTGKNQLGRGRVAVALIIFKQAFNTYSHQHNLVQQQMGIFTMVCEVCCAWLEGMQDGGMCWRVLSAWVLGWMGNEQLGRHIYFCDKFVPCLQYAIKVNAEEVQNVIITVSRYGWRRSLDCYLNRILYEQAQSSFSSLQQQLTQQHSTLAFHIKLVQLAATYGIVQLDGDFVHILLKRIYELTIPSTSFHTWASPQHPSQQGGMLTQMLLTLCQYDKSCAQWVRKKVVYCLQAQMEVGWVLCILLVHFISQFPPILTIIQQQLTLHHQHQTSLYIMLYRAYMEDCEELPPISDWRVSMKMWEIWGDMSYIEHIIEEITINSIQDMKLMEKVVEQTQGKLKEKDIYLILEKSSTFLHTFTGEQEQRIFCTFLKYVALSASTEQLHRYIGKLLLQTSLYHQQTGEALLILVKQQPQQVSAYTDLILHLHFHSPNTTSFHLLHRLLMYSPNIPHHITDKIVNNLSTCDHHLALMTTLSLHTLIFYHYPTLSEQTLHHIITVIMEKLSKYDRFDYVEGKYKIVLLLLWCRDSERVMRHISTPQKFYRIVWVEDCAYRVEYDIPIFVNAVLSLMIHPPKNSSFIYFIQHYAHDAVRACINCLYRVFVKQIRRSKNPNPPFPPIYHQTNKLLKQMLLPAYAQVDQFATFQRFYTKISEQKATRQWFIQLTHLYLSQEVNNALSDLLRVKKMFTDSGVVYRKFMKLQK